MSCNCWAEDSQWSCIGIHLLLGWPGLSGADGPQACARCPALPGTLGQLQCVHSTLCDNDMHALQLKELFKK